MKSYTDVVIHVRPALQEGGARYPVEAQINGSGLWKGESEFDFEELGKERDAQAYGDRLATRLLNPSVARALQQAGAGRGDRVRIRLLLEEDDSIPHWVRWERMWMRVGAADWPVATSPEIPFSRYIPDERPDREPPDDDVFRLLLAVANPSDFDNTPQQIQVEQEIVSLLGEFADADPSARFRVRLMPGRTQLSDALVQRIREAHWDIAQGTTSLENIQRHLSSDGGFHALHIICHGNFKQGTRKGQLLLEKPDGSDGAGGVIAVEDQSLRSWIHPKLQLIFFQSCKTAAPVAEGDPPFAGIAPTVVKLGVPAAVAMQDFVLMTDARVFARGFYQSLLQDGYIDEAVNAGRRAISSLGGDFTIPALFMSLKGGRLWRPDPVAQDVRETRNKLGPQPKPLPLRAIEHARGLEYDPAQGAEGPLFDLTKRLDQLVDENWLTCLTGPSGFNKTGQLRLQFERLATRFLKGLSDTAPFLLTVSELAEWGRFRSAALPAGLRGGMQAVATRRKTPPELDKRTFVFLVEVDQDLPDQADKVAVDTLLELLAAFPGSRALMVYDETALVNLREKMPAADSFDVDSGRSVKVLVVRPMEWNDLRRYLAEQGEVELSGELEARHLTDLANAPWILTRLRDFADPRRLPANRAEALSLVASTYLVDFDARRAPRACAEQALESIAWTVQQERTPSLDSEVVLGIADQARNRRDFRLGDLLGALTDCHVLTASGDERYRFSYRALQTYFAARYIHRSPRKMDLVEDITATLGRYSRMRHWEHVMIALAGMQTNLRDRVLLLQALVAGSSLIEGEQVFLAARMYTEMVDSRDAKGKRGRFSDPALAKDKVVRQILDALVWRSRPDIPRPYAERRQAVERLAEMRHPEAIPHLVDLAAKRFPVAPGVADEAAAAATATAPGQAPVRRNTFDNSGIRMLAVNGLLLQMEAALEHIASRDAEFRAEFGQLIDAWWKLAEGDLQPVLAILEANTESLSPVAAFALAQAGMEVGGEPLRRMLPWQRPGVNNELLWAITEIFGQQESPWLQGHVIQPWLARDPAPDRNLCYLIQKSGEAPKGSADRNYLLRCLADKQPAAQDRALRALAKLNDDEVNAWLGPLCHDIVAGTWKAVLDSEHVGLERAPEGGQAWRLRQAALEVLRDIGGEPSIEEIRSSRMEMDPVLFQLSCQVTEQIYWRLTGGLAREHFGTN